MKIAIVGGNSQVGTELCFLLRAQGYEVLPIVRSLLGAAFLRHHGFECRLADISNAKDATRVLGDIDHVVLSVYVSDVGGPSRQSRKTSDMLIKNAVLSSPPTSSVVYFSSIRAFSRRVDPASPIWGMAYDNEKRHGESTLFQACRQRGKAGYALRLGHVFGKHQSKTRTFKSLLGRSDPVVLEVEPDRPSNVVHTVTIADALIKIWASGIQPGIYSLVNSPQWSWKKVAEYYAEGRTLIFLPGGSRTDEHLGGTFRKKLNAIRSSILKYGRTNFALLRPWLMPTGLDRYLQYRAIAQKVETELRQINQAVLPLRIPEFGYFSIPGPFVPGLSDTRALLQSVDVPNGIFE